MEIPGSIQRELLALQAKCTYLIKDMHDERVLDETSTRLVQYHQK
jgi:hypothetical protein